MYDFCGILRREHCLQHDKQKCGKIHRQMHRQNEYGWKQIILNIVTIDLCPPSFPATHYNNNKSCNITIGQNVSDHDVNELHKRNFIHAESEIVYIFM